MTLTGKPAEDLLNEIALRNAEQRAERLARAKAAAAVAGKEPFDFARLETLCDTSREGRLDSEAIRAARFEELYYVDFPDIRTLEELAAKVAERNRW